MAVTLVTTGPYAPNTNNRQEFSSIPDYSYCSAPITTTATYAGNELDFGVHLKEVVIVNSGANPVAIQWPAFYDSGKDCGIIPGNSTVTLRNANKKGMRLRSADTALPTTVYVWGV